MSEPQKVLIVIGNSAQVPRLSGLVERFPPHLGGDDDTTNLIIGINRFGTRAAVLADVNSGVGREVEIVNRAEYAGSQGLDGEARGTTEIQLEAKVSQLEHDLANVTLAWNRRTAQLEELEHHAGHLTRLLADAWWVEAAQHLHALQQLTGGDDE